LKNPRAAGQYQGFVPAYDRHALRGVHIWHDFGCIQHPGGVVECGYDKAE